MLVLGIESSCDETAAAVVRNGNEILSSEIFSQISLHQPFGGVVPELASREHLTRIRPIVDAAIRNAGIERSELNAVAVTQGPGLIGSLMVGVSFAKSFAFGLGIPCIGVNHIEGHVYSVVFENPPVEFPALALIVSGGHTNLFHIPEEGLYRVISRTRDDAAGEAYDKVAKMLGLGYPGGPVIEDAARKGIPGRIKFPVAKISDGRPDFSFSGLKTAVARYNRENAVEPAEPNGTPSQEICDISAAFQHTVIRSLTRTMEKAARELTVKNLIIAGGVACNQALRDEASEAAKRLGIPLYFPSRHLSTDNAAMIAAAGYAHLKNGIRSDLGLAPDVTLRLQNLQNEDEQLRQKRVRYKL